MKQRTLLWRFKTIHRPGKDKFADAASCFPSIHGADDEVTMSETLCAIMIDEDETGTTSLSVASHDSIRAVTWDLVRDETMKDSVMPNLACLIDTDELAEDLHPYWPIHHNLYIIDGVTLMGDQVLILHTLGHQVTQENIDTSNARIHTTGPSKRSCSFPPFPPSRNNQHE